MADAASIATIISEPLLQAGVLGAFAFYCLYTDWSTRRDNKLMEAARIKREEERERKAEKRESDCIARIQQLENRHQQQMMGALVRNTAVVEAFLKERGIEIPRTPLPGSNDYEPHNRA